MIIFLCWIIIGVFNYGMTFGHFQNTFPTIAKIFHKNDICFGLFMGVLGPIGLITFPIIKLLGVDLRFKNIKFY